MTGTLRLSDEHWTLYNCPQQHCVKTWNAGNLSTIANSFLLMVNFFILVTFRGDCHPRLMNKKDPSIDITKDKLISLLNS